MNRYTWYLNNDSSNEIRICSESQEAAEIILKKICDASLLGDKFEDWVLVNTELDIPVK